MLSYVCPQRRPGTARASIGAAGGGGAGRSRRSRGLQQHNEPIPRAKPISITEPRRPLGNLKVATKPGEV